MSLKANSRDAETVAQIVQVTVITTAAGTLAIAGSTSKSQGASAQGQYAGAYYGANVVAVGANRIAVYSINGTSTRLLGIGTAGVLGVTAAPGPAGLGVCAEGALVVVVLSTGTGQVNILFV